MDDNSHTRVSTSGGATDEGKPVKAWIHIERRMGRPVEGEAVNILFGNQMLVGREKSCEIFLQDDRVSRKHAILKIDPDAARLSDLGSTNGTTRNDEPVTEEIIVETGDLVSFGNARTYEVRIVEKDGIITSTRLASGKDAYLLVPQEFFIGSGGEGQEVDLKIYDPAMLPCHARVEYFTGRTFIVSMDPDKPVLVNSNPVREIEVRKNYMVEIGDTMLRFEF